MSRLQRSRTSSGAAAARTTAAALAAILISGAAAGLPAQGAPDASLHPSFPLLDGSGGSVLDSGAALSTARTCGACHDVEHIEAHSTHAALTGVELAAAVSAPPVSRSDSDAWLGTLGELHAGGPGSGVLEAECLLCHGAGANVLERAAEIRAGRYDRATTALLTATGLVERRGDAFVWNHDAFTADGHADPDLLPIGDPSDAACLACHGTDSRETRLGERTGTAFSGARISASPLNIAGRSELSRPFDVHAERLVGCADCHHSANNPAWVASAADPGVPHLRVDPRKADLGEYLSRPSHQVARSGEGAVEACTGCHTVEGTHEWLPYADRHMSAVACASCHVPVVHGSALQLTDWTLPSLDGEPRREYRGVEGEPGATAYIVGYRPSLLPDSAGPGVRLRPHNPVATIMWVDAAGEAVPQDLLRSALLTGDIHHPELLRALDADRDGRLSPGERRLETGAAVAAVAARLEAAGVRDPRIRVEVDARPVDHGVVRGEWAIRDCGVCHSRTAAALAPIELASALPAGVEPAAVRLTGAAAAAELHLEDGRLVLAPDPGSRGLYILGRDRFDWLNRIGATALLLVMLGAGIHGGLRIWASRNAPAPMPGPRRRVYMYGAYERLWHWLQAVAIIGLLLTGVAIHLPDTFGWAGMPAVVRVHNVLGFILLGNAFLAAFYHLASGKLRQYLPRPRGFFSEAVEQLAYYVRGIFRGEPHPFEKSLDRRLNPLQKVTYLAILNVLLPLQVLTGLLIWLLQELPSDLTGTGALGTLAPVHTLAAWLFAAFLLMHIYLTTTGQTPTSNVRAMVVGWEDVVDVDDVEKIDDVEEEEGTLVGRDHHVT